MGNITSIKENGTVIESYTYDSLNQLKTVTKGSDVWVYTYDNGGNLQTVTKNGVTEKTYTYGSTMWRDLMTKFNGQQLSYDGVGNPLTYRDGMSFTWADCRKLTAITKGTDNISYTYDANGLRNSKTVNGTATQYYWLNGILQGQKTGSEYIIFLHDENGTAYGFMLKNGTTREYYYYIFNAQGDVIGILDNHGTQVVKYTYNAWGELLSTTGTKANTIGQKNPIRYRGYYYDTETGFYYLQSRYYDPITQRFINADGYVSTGQGILATNMFAYCGNNPIIRADPTGNLWWIIPLFVIPLLLAGCEEKEEQKPKPKPSTSSSSSSTSLTQEQKHFISVIAGEAIGANTKTQKAVAHTIMNRVNEPRDVWSKATSVTEVLVSSQYNAVGSPQYNKCMAYLNNRDGNNTEYENLISAVIPIYLGEEPDFTGGAHYIFNVNGSVGLLRALESQPQRYVKCGPISGISDTEYRMYRCLW